MRFLGVVLLLVGLPQMAAGQVPDAATVDSVMAFTLRSHMVISRDIIGDTETGDCVSRVVFVRDGPNTYGDYYNWAIGWFPRGDYWNPSTNPGVPTTASLPDGMPFREPVPALADWLRANGSRALGTHLDGIVQGLEARYAETGRTAWGWADLLRQAGQCR